MRSELFRLLCLSLPERVVTGNVGPPATVGGGLAFVSTTPTDAAELPGASHVPPRSLDGPRAIFLHLRCSFVANVGAVTVVEDAGAVPVSPDARAVHVSDGNVHGPARLAPVDRERRRPCTVRPLEHDHLRPFTSSLAHTRFSASQLARYLRLCGGNNSHSAKQCWNQNDFPHDNLWRRGWGLSDVRSLPQFCARRRTVRKNVWWAHRRRR